MRLLYTILADIIWLLHFCIVAIALFGWLFPQFAYVYIVVLASVLISNLIFNYCVLSRWEYSLRRKYNPEIEYEYAYTSYYTYKLTRGYLSRNFLRGMGLTYAIVALVIQMYFYWW